MWYSVPLLCCLVLVSLPIYHIRPHASMPRNSTATSPTALVAIPDGVTAEEAHQFLQQLAIRYSLLSRGV